MHLARRPPMQAQLLPERPFWTVIMTKYARNTCKSNELPFTNSLDYCLYAFGSTHAYLIS